MVKKKEKKSKNSLGLNSYLYDVKLPMGWIKQIHLSVFLSNPKLTEIIRHTQWELIQLEQKERQSNKQSVYQITRLHQGIGI